MMKCRRENIKSPRRKNLPISRQLNKLDKTTLISTVSAASVPQSSNIKVVVRVRPPSSRELGDNHRIVIKVVDENVLIFDPKENAEPFFYHGVQQKTRDFLRKSHKDLQFAFNRVFDCNVDNLEVFNNSTKPLINSLMDGINCSVFAYGATGAGKTHTMLGNQTNPGITFLTMEQLFQAKEELSEERDFELGITYLEVYNEIVQDLLCPGSTLTLREDHKFGVVVAGIKYVTIQSANELFSLLDQGNKNRTQHPTDANAESSRSHAVFQVYIKMKYKVSGEIRMAKLSMIDLAGSERGSATGFQGARFAEGANINKSLLALGNCINSLADCQRHIPYRDSKLTRLLKDSLGGNCQTVMIANISPSSFSYEDTYNTLRYATRAKAIKATIKRNVVNIDLKIEHYVKIADELQKKVANRDAEINKLKEENNKLKEELNAFKKKINKPQLLLQPLPQPVQEPDENALDELNRLMEQKKEIMTRLHAMENSYQIVQLRSELKEEANSRLSGLCYDTPDKEERHRRLDNTISRFNKQKETYKKEKDMLTSNLILLDTQTKNLLEKHPELNLNVQVKQLEMSRIQEEHNNELSKKELKICREQLKQQGELIEKMSSLLKPCYLQLKALEQVSDENIISYESLISEIQGIRSISWEDDPENPVSDSGVCSATTITQDEPTGSSICSPSYAQFKTPPVKSPLILRSSPPVERTAIGDVTFSVNTPRKTPLKPVTKAATKPKICSDQLLVKGYKPSPMKKPRLNTTVSKAKENWPTVRVAKGPVHRTKTGLDSNASSKSVSLSSRPPFRR